MISLEGYTTKNIVDGKMYTYINGVRDVICNKHDEW